jgi:hypothetical protein
MLRRSCLGLLLVVPLLLAGCQLAVPGRGTDATPPEGVQANAITGGEIEVTALDEVPAAEVPQATAGDGTAPPPQAASPDPASADASTADPAPAPKPPVSEEPTDAVAAARKPAAQIACEKKGGRWTQVGRTVVSTCVKLTGQGDKRCTRESQCEGQCLARSGTCAPVDPLLGCNEVLQNNGARVTLCIE